MERLTLGSMEEQFMEIVWENAPIGSGKLVKLAAEKLGWKKPTTYTVLRRMEEKGLLANEDTTVRVLKTRDEFNTSQVFSHFKGSLPSFISAFTTKNKLSKKDIEEIRKIIDECGEDDK